MEAKRLERNWLKLNESDSTIVNCNLEASAQFPQFDELNVLCVLEKGFLLNDLKSITIHKNSKNPF